MVSADLVPSEAVREKPRHSAVPLGWFPGWRRITPVSAFLFMRRLPEYQRPRSLLMRTQSHWIGAHLLHVASRYIRREPVSKLATFRGAGGGGEDRNLGVGGSSIQPSSCVSSARTVSGLHSPAPATSERMQLGLEGDNQDPPPPAAARNRLDGSPP